MNKDVIYVEPEDDITDIILKIEKAKEKIVALVPPKKAGVFRSVVNIKLIAKAGATSGKTIVLVTVDPSIVKLAAATKLPVAKNLQSAPVIPEIEDEPDEPEEEELIEEADDTVETEADVEALNPSMAEKKTKKAEEDADEEDGEEEEEEPEKKPKEKKKKPAKSGNKFINWIKGHKKSAIFLLILILGVIGFLVWAFVIAPSAVIKVGIKTTSNNVSETVKFTTNQVDAKPSEGLFYLQLETLDVTQEVLFDATGQKNVGERASGEVTVYAYFKDKGSIQINQGSGFAINGLSYASGGAVTLSWDGQKTSDCENEKGEGGEASPSLVTAGCLRSATVPVTATEPGAKYNVAASSTGWSTAAPVTVKSEKAMSGGTDSIITVVQQSDIVNAENQLTASNEAQNKEDLYNKIGDDKLIIDSTFKQTTSDAVATPAVGEEVKDGTKPVLKATTTASVYTVDKSEIEEFIKAKANLSDSQKIYEIKNPFIENFAELSSGFTGRFKTTYMTGPKITENDVIDKAKGKGLGEVQHDLRDIDGVATVEIDKSYPWVTSVPNDPNKITVIFEVKDQDGNKIEQNDEGSDGQKKDEQKKPDEKEKS